MLLTRYCRPPSEIRSRSQGCSPESRVSSGSSSANSRRCPSSGAGAAAQPVYFPDRSAAADGRRHPFPAHRPAISFKQHFQAGSIAVFPGSTLLRKLCSPHHARDIVQLGLLRRLHRGRLRFALFIQHQKGTDVLTAGALAVFVIRAGTAGAHKAAVFPQPGLRMVAVSSAAAHIGRQMPHAVFAGLTVQVFHPVQIRLGPRKDGTAQQIADLFHVHARFLPLQCSIG